MKSGEAESYYNEEEGLACPPMDDYVLSDDFLYDANINLDPDVFFAGLSKEKGEEEQLHSRNKSTLASRYCGKGKQWERVLQVLEPDVELLAKVNAELGLKRCHLAVQGPITCSPRVVKARKTVKIVVKKQFDVVMQKKKDGLTDETRRPLIQMPINRNGKENDFELKFEATKRKLRGLYDQANNLKKQRTTKLIDLQHLPPMPTSIRKSLKPKPKPGVGKTKTITWRNRL